MNLIGPILWGHSGPLSRVVVVVIVVVVVDIDFTLPFTRCRYCRTPPARYSYSWLRANLGSGVDISDTW